MIFVYFKVFATVFEEIMFVKFAYLVKTFVGTSSTFK